MSLLMLKVDGMMGSLMSLTRGGVSWEVFRGQLVFSRFLL